MRINSMESSNNSIDQYKEKIESGIIDLRKTWDDAKEAGWTEVKNKNGIVVVTKKEEGSAIQRYSFDLRSLRLNILNRYAGRTILKGNKETLFNLLKGLDHVAEVIYRNELPNLIAIKVGQKLC